jgi:hypothetical protein
MFQSLTSTQVKAKQKKKQKEQRASDNFCYPLLKTINWFYPGSNQRLSDKRSAVIWQANRSSSRSVRSLNPLTTIPNGRD